MITNNNKKIEKDLKYKKLTIENIPKYIINSFSNLITDDYIKDKYTKDDFKYRTRKFSQLKIKYLNDYFFEDADNQILYQENNKVYGDIKRTYHQIDPNVKDYICDIIKVNILNHISKSEYLLVINQIKNIATEKYLGLPAPEGIHSDGYDYVCIYCINVINVSGGITILTNYDNENDLIYEDTLKSGEILMFNDVKYKHYTTPITPKIPSIEAERSTFILAFRDLKKQIKENKN